MPAIEPFDRIEYFLDTTCLKVEFCLEKRRYNIV